MKRRKLALVMAMAMVLTSVPAGSLSVSAEDFQDGFTAGSEVEDSEEFAGEETAEAATTQESAAPEEGFQDGGDGFVSDETEEDVTATEEGNIEATESADAGTQADGTWHIDYESSSRGGRAEYNSEQTLEVVISGDKENLTFTWWKKTFGPEPGDESVERIINDTDSLDVKINEKATYICTVTGEDGREETCEFEFEVNSHLAFVDEDAPDDYSAYIGEVLKLDASATAMDEAELTYQWFYSEDEEYDDDDDDYEEGWDLIEDANTPTYECTVEYPWSEAYMCVVSDNFGNTIRRYFDIEGKSGLNVEGEYYKTLEVEPNSSCDLSVNATAYYGELSIQWYVGQRNEDTGAVEWTELNGATQTEYNVPKVEKNSYYRCIVTNGYQTIFREYILKVNSGLTVDNNAETVTIKPNETPTLSVNASTSLGTLSYRWFFRGYSFGDIALEGDTSNYTVDQFKKTGYYICEVSDGYDTKTKTFYVQVDTGFEITAPNDQEIGTEFDVPVLLKAEATSELPLQYQWYRDYYDEENLIDGATSATYETKLTENMKYAAYCCVITDGYNTGNVRFTVNIDTGLTVSAPEFVWINLGEQAELKVTASTKSAYGPLSYDWYVYGYDTEEREYGWQYVSEDGDTLKTGAITEPTSYRCTVSDKYANKTVFITVASKEHQGQTAENFDKAKELISGVDNTATILNFDGKMYFKFVPQTSGEWKFYSNCGLDDDYDTVAELYDENRKYIDGNDDDEDDDNNVGFGLRATLTAGKTYYLACGFFESDVIGSYPVRVELMQKCEHKWNSGKVTQVATCAAEGQKTYTCNLCGETKTEPIEKLSHNLVTKIDKAATCVPGSQHRECTVCGWKEAATEIPATGKHTMKTVVDQAATCGAAGSQHNECTVCGLKEAATAIPATGNHTYGEYTVTKEATAVAEGTKVRTCSVCGATDSAVIAKIPGTIKAVASKVPLQLKKSVALSKLVTGLAAGDSINMAACTSSKPSIAAIDKSGKVTAKKAGTTVVTIKLASGVSTNVTVTVQKKAVATKAISISKTLKLTVGDKQTLAPVISPITTLDKVTYTTSNSKIVSVTKSGAVTAKKAGTATIKVKSGKKTVSIKVTVAGKAPTGMTGVAATKTLKKGKSFTIKAKLTPSGADAKITYKSSNSKVASVSAKGKVTAKKKGTATITVKAGNITKTCVVTVK